MAYLLHGPLSGTVDLEQAEELGASFGAEFSYEDAGTKVASAGDVNEDGFDDVLVGIPLYPSDGSNRGVTYLLYGPSSGDVRLSEADYIFRGYSGDQAGYSVSPAGDVNGDGPGDFLVGAPGSDFGGDGAGAAYLFYGSQP